MLSLGDNFKLRTVHQHKLKQRKKGSEELRKKAREPFLIYVHLFFPIHNLYASKSHHILSHSNSTPILPQFHPNSFQNKSTKSHSTQLYSFFELISSFLLYSFPRVKVYPPNLISFVPQITNYLSNKLQ